MEESQIADSWLESLSVSTSVNNYVGNGDETRLDMRFLLKL